MSYQFRLPDNKQTKGPEMIVPEWYSGLHFGHYKAASFDPALSALHAAKLTLCAKMGVPLARWGFGLTVLLEKNCGNNFVN